MLCPEVWNFKAPRNKLHLKAQFQKKECNNYLISQIKNHSFYHSVSLIFPDLNSIPESFCENILEDSDYYRVNGLRAVELINEQFIATFILQGTLQLLTIEKKVDVDNLISITPNGYLRLNLRRSYYHKLGIEGKSTNFEYKDHSSYVVKINLKHKDLVPGKKYYEGVYNKLNKLLNITFDVIISWEPPEIGTCPSSIAAWFNKRGFTVKVCRQDVIRRCEYSLNIPILEKNHHDEFLEWLGFFSIGGNLINENKNEEVQYISSYELSDSKKRVGKIQYLQFTGFFTQAKILKIFNLWKNLASLNNTILPWCSINVQGFSDSPINWNEVENNYYTDGNYSFTIVMRPSDEGYISRKNFISIKKPMKKQ